jgi:hypothetical protein
MYDDSDNPFLSIQETADLLRVKRGTLDNLRWKGEGPAWRRHGGRVVYHWDEVLAWSEQRCSRTITANEKWQCRPNGQARASVATRRRRRPKPRLRRYRMFSPAAVTGTTIDVLAVSPVDERSPNCLTATSRRLDTAPTPTLSRSSVSWVERREIYRAKSGAPFT